MDELLDAVSDMISEHSDDYDVFEDVNGDIWVNDYDNGASFPISEYNNIYDD